MLGKQRIHPGGVRTESFKAAVAADKEVAAGTASVRVTRDGGCTYLTWGKTHVRFFRASSQLGDATMACLASSWTAASPLCRNYRECEGKALPRYQSLRPSRIWRGSLGRGADGPSRCE